MHNKNMVNPESASNKSLGSISKTKSPSQMLGDSYVGAAQGTRTPNQLVRSQLLYPIELAPLIKHKDIIY